MPHSFHRITTLEPANGEEQRLGRRAYKTFQAMETFDVLIIAASYHLLNSHGNICTICGNTGVCTKIGLRGIEYKRKVNIQGVVYLFAGFDEESAGK